MDSFAKLAPNSPDLQNSKKLRWQKSAKSRFDTLELLTYVLIRASGDTLTSVGNYIINWTMYKVIDAIARSVANMDWRQHTFEDMCLALPDMLNDPQWIKHILSEVEEEAKWVCEAIRRESYGLPTRPPDSDFICGEGDDKAKRYKWSFFQLFETSDTKGKRCREVLGYVVGLLYCAAGMSLEPQDRTGRVGFDKLIDSTGRIEFVSRIFVEIDQSTMYSYPKLRKTFAAARVTFNMEESLHAACAVKMLSLIAVSEQCPLQSQIYAMLFRFHQYLSDGDSLDIHRRKFDWWEYKLSRLVQDNGLQASRWAVYKHLMGKVADWQYPESTRAMLASLSKEMQMEVADIQSLIDAAKENDGRDVQQVVSLIRHYVAVLPPV